MFFFIPSVDPMQEDDGGRTVKVEVSLLVLRLPAGVQPSPPHTPAGKMFVPEDLTSTSVGKRLCNRAPYRDMTLRTRQVCEQLTSTCGDSLLLADHICVLRKSYKHFD